MMACDKSESVSGLARSSTIVEGACYSHRHAGENRYPDSLRFLDSVSPLPAKAGITPGLPGMTTEFCCEFLGQDTTDC